MNDGIARELAEIAKHGTLTPDDVIAYAKRNPESALHAAFEWDDSEAAKKWRIDQARRLIRSVDVHVINEKTHVTAVAYVRDPDAGVEDQGYVATASLRDDPERAKAVLKYELGRAECILERCESLASLFGMKDAVALTMQRLRALKRRVG